MAKSFHAWNSNLFSIKFWSLLESTSAASINLAFIAINGSIYGNVYLKSENQKQYILNPPKVQ